MQFAAHYPGCYFHEQCVYLGNAIVITGVCHLTRSHQLQGMWRQIQSQQSFASAMDIPIIPLSKRIFQQLFCSVVNGKGSLTARKNAYVRCTELGWCHS